MKAIRTEEVEIIAYLVRYSDGQTATVTATQFEAEYTVVNDKRAIDRPPSPNLSVIDKMIREQVGAKPLPEKPKVMPRPKDMPAPEEPDDIYNVICTQCSGTYKRGTGSRDGLLCADCTMVKCPECKEPTTLSDAKEYGSCRQCSDAKGF